MNNRFSISNEENHNRNNATSYAAGCKPNCMDELCDSPLGFFNDEKVRNEALQGIKALDLLAEEMEAQLLAEKRQQEKAMRDEIIANCQDNEERKRLLALL